MRPAQKIFALVLVAGLGGVGYGLLRTSAIPGHANPPNDAAAAPQALLVDQVPLKTARQLAQFADTPDEQALASQAADTADHEVDLAFAQALREATLYPPPLSPQAEEIRAQLQRAQKTLQADQAQLNQFAAAAQKATGERKEALEDQLALSKAQVELDQDEVDDAREDLIRKGGDQHGRIRQMQQEHDEAGHNAPVTFPAAPPQTGQGGLIPRYRQWSVLRQKKRSLAQAKFAAQDSIAVLVEQHDALEAQLDAEKFNSPGLASHSTLAETPETKASGEGAGASQTPSADARPQPPQENAALLAQTQQIAASQQNLAGFDKRMDAQKRLAEIYGQWIGLVEARQRLVLRRILIGAAIILGIALIALFFNTWMEKLFGRLPLDKRQTQTLRTVTRVALQVVAVLFILLVIFGPPGQLGTFLGLAGAGLTVALKDFIVGLFGWFVLMGKNGIRLGDWVEINGVTGEVVEIGLFHTVLLETGNWTDSGHPTGRRVTFTNSFAIEGHYFNFSTAGQWLWDELQVVVPAGQDPYPLIEAIQKNVEEVTRASAQQAEQEWKRAAGSRELAAISAAPAINLKPVSGGIEISVRYITRAHERHVRRVQLYQAMVNLLGGKSMAARSGT